MWIKNPPTCSPRISPDVSELVRETAIFRFKKFWTNPKPMLNRPFLSVWSLHVHNYKQLMDALDAAHSLKCVHTLSVAYYGKDNFVGTCVVPNSEIN